MNQQNQEIQQQQIHKRQPLWTPQIIDFQFTIAHGVVLVAIGPDLNVTDDGHQVIAKLKAHMAFDQVS
jgi:hypothetical protein